jgi:hypothetical protein
VFLARQVDGLATGDDLVPALLFIPLAQRGGHVHLFDDVAPTDAGVRRAEADFAFLRGVGNDSLLSADEICFLLGLTKRGARRILVSIIYGTTAKGRGCDGYAGPANTISAG